MTLTLELSPELERALENEARRRGVETSQLALEALEKVVQPSRRKKVLKGHGMFAGKGSMEDSLRALHELDEAQRSEERRVGKECCW